MRNLMVILGTVVIDSRNSGNEIMFSKTVSSIQLTRTEFARIK